MSRCSCRCSAPVPLVPLAKQGKWRQALNCPGLLCQGRLGSQALTTAQSSRRERSVGGRDGCSRGHFRKESLEPGWAGDRNAVSAVAQLFPRLSLCSCPEKQQILLGGESGPGNTRQRGDPVGGERQPLQSSAPTRGTSSSQHKPLPDGRTDLWLCTEELFLLRTGRGRGRLPEWGDEASLRPQCGASEARHRALPRPGWVSIQLRLGGSRSPGQAGLGSASRLLC